MTSSNLLPFEVLMSSAVDVDSIMSPSRTYNFCFHVLNYIVCLKIHPSADRVSLDTLVFHATRMSKSPVKWRPIQSVKWVTNGSSTTRQRRSKYRGIATTTTRRQVYSATNRQLRSITEHSSVTPLTRPVFNRNLASFTFSPLVRTCTTSLNSEES